MAHVIALWAVPRSVSTAFELCMQERGDHQIVHEPFFDAFEKSVGRSPADAYGFNYEAAIRATRSDILKVGSNVNVFMKDMAYHVEALADKSFLAPFKNAFIVRHPLLTFQSLQNLTPPARVEPRAFSALYRLYEVAAEIGPRSTPPIVVADDLVTSPGPVMRAFCETMGIEFLPSALSWRAGFRRVWQEGKESYWQDERRWYDSVASSTSITHRTTASIDLANLNPYENYANDVLIYEALASMRLQF